MLFTNIFSYFLAIYIRYRYKTKKSLLALAEGWGALGGYLVYGIGYIGYI